MRFRLRMTLCIVMLLALAFGAGGTMLISVSFRESLDSERDIAVRSHRMLANTLVLANNISAQTDIEDLVSTLRQLDRQDAAPWSGLRLQQGERVLYASGSLPYPDTAAAEPGQCYIRLYANDGVGVLQVSGMLQVNSGDYLSLDAGYTVSHLYAVRQIQMDIFYRLLAAVVTVGAAVSWVLAMLLTRPLYQLGRVTRQIAGGNLASRANIRSGDEFEQLAADFNRMTDRVEEDIAALQDAMRRQEEFMGSFAHEMKTPMTSIIGYADLLRGQSLPPEDQQQAANYIFSEGQRLESLSLKLLDLLVMGKDEPEMRLASPQGLITSLVQMLRPSMAERDITLQCRCEPGQCRMEPDLVKSLVTNLIDNARKAMDGAGNIFVLSDMTDTGCRIRVVDNGRGMPASEVSRVTEAFYRVDKSRSRAQGGVGLGLALCQRIAKLHGGDISFQSAEGKGTIVTVTLNGGRGHE